jgi:uncharacterized repeat protein (TIGR03803 family)
MKRARRLCLERLLTALLGIGFAALRLGAQSFEIVHSFGPNGTGSPIGSLVLLADGTLIGVTEGSGRFGQGTVFALTPDGMGGFSSVVLHDFAGFDGLGPGAGVTVGADGYLYGTTVFGGLVPGSTGTAFRMTSSGHFTMIHSFNYSEGDVPFANLIEAPVGTFWGTASDGGTLGHGAVFRIDATGDSTTVHSFTFDDGASPHCRLVLASDGNFYGTTQQGGANGYGTIFQMTAAGALTTLHDFTASEGGFASSLTEGSPGLLYGVTPYGGASNQGIVFTVDFSGTVTVIHEFDGADGWQPQSRLVPASAGGFFGTTSLGGPDGAGTVFHVTEAGAITTRHTFSYTSGGTNPDVEILEAPGGTLYGGTTGGGSLGGGTVFRIDLDDTFTILWEFAGNEPLNPYGGLLRASDGNLYGTTSFASQTSGGAVFRLDADDQIVVLHYLSQEEGASLSGTLLEGPDGDLYGTAGTSGPAGLGTLFKISTAGDFTLLHTFSLLDSGQPTNGLTDGGDGFLYGVESGAGQNGDLFGEVFRIDTAGNFSSVHVFGGSDGAGPSAPPIRASNGALYGTTIAGGANPPDGTVYRIDSGTLTTIYNFARTDGAAPGAILQAADGNLYGICLIGGPQDQGTIFKVDSLDSLSTLFDFASAASPTSIMQGTDSALHESTAQGGSGVGQGTAFRVGLDGSPTILHTFQGYDGGQPYGRLLEQSDGSFLGTTVFGGLSNFGVIYRILPAAAAPTIGSLQPSAGRAAGGTTLTVNGMHFQPLPVVTIGGSPDFPTPREIDSRTIRAMAPAFPPGTLQDVTVTNADASTVTLPGGWFADFLDVGSIHPLHDFVESIVRAGITAGCGGGDYCVDATVTRAQMAVFLLKAEHGSGYAPPVCQGVFADVPCPGGFAVDWIEQIHAEGVAAGCGSGNYCPNAAVTRAQMAVLLLKTSLGASYVPPVVAPIFDDVPAGAFAADWINDLSIRGITAGCSAAPPLYCPNAMNTRGQMAAFLTKTFSLQ